MFLIVLIQHLCNCLNRIWIIFNDGFQYVYNIFQHFHICYIWKRGIWGLFGVVPTVKTFQGVTWIWFEVDFYINREWVLCGNCNLFHSSFCVQDRVVAWCDAAYGFVCVLIVNDNVCSVYFNFACNDLDLLVQLVCGNWNYTFFSCNVWVSDSGNVVHHVWHWIDWNIDIANFFSQRHVDSICLRYLRSNSWLSIQIRTEIHRSRRVWSFDGG